MHMQLWNTALLITDVVKVFNPQSPQARAMLDLAIVVIAVMVVIFAIVVGIAREDCATARQLLLSDSSATGLGYFLS
jgi:heme/copper-type cytochrome/quinol oxidase subunit 2